MLTSHAPPTAPPVHSRAVFARPALAGVWVLFTLLVGTHPLHAQATPPGANGCVAARLENHECRL